MPRQSYAALQAKIEKEIEKLKKQAQALQSKKRLPVIRSIIKSMKEYDITPDEIVAAFGKSPRASRALLPNHRLPKAALADLAALFQSSTVIPSWVILGLAVARHRAGSLKRKRLGANAKNI
jgi:DNA-binding protein H-NS